MILKQSGLDNTKLYKIWGLAERKRVGDDHGKGFLLRNEFILALHLIKKGKLGFPIPDKLPSNMEQFLQEYKEVMMTTSTGFDSVGLANSKLPGRESSF